MTEAPHHHDAPATAPAETEHTPVTMEAIERLLKKNRIKTVNAVNKSIGDKNTNEDIPHDSGTQEKKPEHGEPAHEKKPEHGAPAHEKKPEQSEPAHEKKHETKPHDHADSHKDTHADHDHGAVTKKKSTKSSTKLSTPAKTLGLTAAAGLTGLAIAAGHSAPILGTLGLESSVAANALYGWLHSVMAPLIGQIGTAAAMGLTFVVTAGGVLLMMKASKGVFNGLKKVARYGKEKIGNAFGWLWNHRWKFAGGLTLGAILATAGALTPAGGVVAGLAAGAAAPVKPHAGGHDHDSHTPGHAHDEHHS